MGGGSWSTSAYTAYSCSAGRTINTVNGVTTLANTYTAQDIFKSNRLQPELNPYKCVRQCCDIEEHPNTIPVILALDVTGSMGDASAEVAKKLNEVMTELYTQVQDVEFCVMGIGDLSYDSAPIQMSQFESDVRIAEHLDKVYFEAGGGGNGFESYTVAWYMGLKHCDLDCWKRGKKGIIITMGDEPLNPYLPAVSLGNVTGDISQGDIETDTLYTEVIEKFDIYHLAVNDIDTSYRRYESRIKESFGKYFDEQHLKIVSLDNIAKTIVDIVTKTTNNSVTNSEISW